MTLFAISAVISMLARDNYLAIYFEIKSVRDYMKLIFGTSNIGHLFVVREFVVVSHLKIFPLQLLGPAEKPMAGPSSCKGKFLR